MFLMALGMSTSFLGAIYYYAVNQQVATGPGQNTEEWLDGDSVWNQVRLHQRLFQVWADGGVAPVFWTPDHLWVWQPPADAKPWKAVNLRGFCQPQAVLLRNLSLAKHGPVLRQFIFYSAMLALGLLLLLIVVMKTIYNASRPYQWPARNSTRRARGPV